MQLKISWRDGFLWTKASKRLSRFNFNYYLILIIWADLLFAYVNTKNAFTSTRYERALFLHWAFLVTTWPVKNKKIKAVMTGTEIFLRGKSLSSEQTANRRPDHTKHNHQKRTFGRLEWVPIVPHKQREKISSLIWKYDNVDNRWQRAIAQRVD